MHNFFVDENQFKDNKTYITGNDFNHVKNVLRMKSGDQFYVSNKETGKSYLAELNKILENEIECDILKEMDSKELNVQVTLYQGLPKSDKMELIIQKSVELGVYNIVPVDMKYCVAKLNNEEKKIQRWQTISESAAKQSKRNIIPKIEGKRTFKKMIQEIPEYDLAIIAYENENKTTLKEIINEYKNAKKIAIIIGPEGGLATEEVETILSNGGKSASLGKRILRTETASLAMLSMMVYEFEL